MTAEIERGEEDTTPRTGYLQAHSRGGAIWQMESRASAHLTKVDALRRPHGGVDRGALRLTAGVMPVSGGYRHEFGEEMTSVFHDEQKALSPAMAGRSASTGANFVRLLSGV